MVGDDTQSLGSGFVAQANRIVTAAHVVAAATSPASVVVGSRKYPARVVGTDAQQDPAGCESGAHVGVERVMVSVEVARSPANDFSATGAPPKW